MSLRLANLSHKSATLSPYLDKLSPEVAFLGSSHGGEQSTVEGLDFSNICLYVCPPSPPPTLSLDGSHLDLAGRPTKLAERPSYLDGRHSDLVGRLSDLTERPTNQAKRPSELTQRPSDPLGRPSDLLVRPLDLAKSPSVPQARPQIWL